jgi:hypothetical protein
LAYEPYLDPHLSLDPDSGPAGSSFEAELTNTDLDITGQLVELIWDLDFPAKGELMGSVTWPAGETSVSIQAKVPPDAAPGEHTVTRCMWDSSSEIWLLGVAPFQVTGPIVEPTPPSDLELKPGPEQVWNCPQAGKWSVATWQGGCGGDVGEALAACGEGAVDAAYYLDPETQEWSRWFRGHPDASNLVAREGIQNLLLLGSPTASPLAGEAAALPAVGEMVGCPLPGKWSIAVWPGDDSDGADGTDTTVALDTCPVWPVDVAYALDSATGTWQRWFRYAADTEADISHAAGSKPADINTLDKLKPGQQLMALGHIGPLQEYTAYHFLPADPLEDSESGHIVFSSDRDGDADIYRMYGDGANQIELTHNDNAEDIQPAWSPDGLYIAFASNQDREDDDDTDPENSFNIYVMDNVGARVKSLFTTHYAVDQFNPFWSPDDDKICYDQTAGCGFSSSCWEIVCLDWPPPEGGWGPSEGGFRPPGQSYVCENTWNTTFKETAMSGCNNIDSKNGDWARGWSELWGRFEADFTYECNTASGDPVDVLCDMRWVEDRGWTFDYWLVGLGVSSFDPAWAPGDFPLALASNAPWEKLCCGSFADTDDPREKLCCGSFVDTQPTDFNIWLLSEPAFADSFPESSLRITDDPATDRQPTWSPGGFEIAFVSDRSGTDQIYTIHNGGPSWKGPWGNVTPLTSTGRNVDPDWFEGLYRKIFSCPAAP